MGASMEFEFANRIEEIARLAEAVDAFSEREGIPPGHVYALNLSLDELITNLVSYGYADDAEHRIQVAVHLEPDAVVVDMVDDGQPFNPFTEAPEPDIAATVEDRAVGGLGVFLVRELMDAVEYHRDGERNRVRLRKHLPGRSPPDTAD
jgi:anti-sigma regulatory factor (Ser/Thr protein kinase)